MKVLQQPKELPVPELTAAQMRCTKPPCNYSPNGGRKKCQRVGAGRRNGAGTVYNNLADLDALFATVANQLSSEMSERIALSAWDLPDPAHRLATGIRFFVRRAHEERHWGRFCFERKQLGFRHWPAGRRRAGSDFSGSRWPENMARSGVGCRRVLPHCRRHAARFARCRRCAVVVCL